MKRTMKEYWRRRKQYSYNELWFMIWGFDTYPGGLLFRYNDAMERIDSLKTTRDILHQRIAKLEKDVSRMEKEIVSLKKK